MNLRKPYPWILLCCILAALLVQGLPGPRPFDDAFITFRYARNLHSGLGFTYNPGARVLGTTTPLFTLLLSLFQPDQIPLASFLISLLADGLNGWLLYRLGRRFFQSPAGGLLAAAAFLFQPFRLDVARGGMEMSLFIAALLLMSDAFLVQKRSLLTGLWAGLAFLLRPDALLAIAPIFIYWLFKEPLRAVKAGLLSAGSAAPWLVWAALYFGSPIPQSIQAKLAAYQNPPGHALFFLIHFLGTGTTGPYPRGIFWVLIGLVAAAAMVVWGIIRLAPHQRDLLMVAIYPVVYLLVMTAQNPAMFFSWYYPPLIPGLILLTCAGPWQALTARPQVQRVVMLGLCAAFILVPAAWMRTNPNLLLDRRREAVFQQACVSAQGQVHPGETILAPDIGVIGWCFPQARILDSVGLVSPEALPYSSGSAARPISPQLIAAFQPAWVFSLEQFLPTEIVEVPAFQASYTLFYQADVQISEDRHQMMVYRLKSAQ